MTQFDSAQMRNMRMNSRAQAHINATNRQMNMPPVNMGMASGQPFVQGQQEKTQPASESKPSGGFNLDSDKALIIILIAVLIKNGAEMPLIAALAYLLL